MWYKCKSRRPEGPYLKDKGSIFLRPSFQFFRRRPVKTVVANFGKSWKRRTLRPSSVYFIPETAYAYAWKIHAELNNISILKFYIFLRFFSNSTFFPQLQIVKLFVFETWILFLSFFLYNRTTLPQLLIHLPATKIGLGVIILPGYKVK